MSLHSLDVDVMREENVYTKIIGYPYSLQALLKPQLVTAYT